MKKLSLVPLLAVLLLVAIGLPSSSSAFMLSANHFSGYTAYDSQYDVVDRYNLDPRLSYENTGKHFNVAAGLTFNFTYDPTYPSASDVMDNPTQDWYWTLEAKNLRFGRTGIPLPSFKLTHTASYADLLAGANWASQRLDDFNIDGCYFFDYQFTGVNTGVASLSMGARVDNCLIPQCTPDHFYLAGDACGDLSLRADPVPEPATMLLFSGGLAGIATWRRRRKNKRA